MNQEQKQEAFKRLAAKRTNAVINKIRILGHCSNPWQYEYSEEDVKKIFKAVDDELRAIKSKFKNTERSNFQL